MNVPLIAYAISDLLVKALIIIAMGFWISRKKGKGP
jgi:hypothetical protein